MIGTTMLTVAQLATRLAVTEGTVRRLARDGRIPAVRVGDTWRFDLESVLGILAVPQPQAPATRVSDDAQKHKE